MRAIDADALISEIKKDTEKAIEQDDRVGSFWLGYIAGLVIKQPTAQPSTSDLISRQEAIDTVSVGAELLRRVLDEVDLVGAEREKYEWGLGLIESCISDIKELPPAQPEPQEGHWIGKYPTTYICSECGWLIPDSKVKVFAYCPNCGAKMKGERQK